ncbi:MAG: class I SAM-dependent methyltransferase [Candidatus Zixiibacteriota bacterium]
MELLNNKLKKLTGGKILDIGTGWGASAQFLVESFQSFSGLTGIDLSKDNIAKAYETFANSQDKEKIKFKQMDACNIEFNDSSFDTVSISNTFHHLNNIPTVLSEMKRVLKPGGLFIFYEMFLDKGSEVENSYHHIHHWFADVDQVVGVPHFHTLTKSEIIELIANLDLKEVEYMVHQNPPIKPNDNPDSIEELIKRCNMFADKIRNDPNAGGLIAKSEEYIQMIKKVGITPDPIISAIGYK